MSIDPSSLRRDARDNYNRLIEAATTILLRDHSIHSLESIAAMAGVGIGTLYRHFPTRKALLEAVYADKLQELVKRANKPILAGSPDKMLMSWLKTTLEYAAKYGEFGELIALESKDKNSAFMSAGSELLKNAQRMKLLRSDVTILDILQLLNGIIASDASGDTLAKKDKLLSVVMSGLKPY